MIFGQVQNYEIEMCWFENNVVDKDSEDLKQLWIKYLNCMCCMKDMNLMSYRNHKSLFDSLILVVDSLTLVVDSLILVVYDCMYWTYCL